MKRKSEIESHRFKPGFPHEIEVVSLGGLFEKAKSMITRPHRAEFYHLLWFQKGKATHLVDFKPIPVRPDTLLFIGKGRVHMFDKLGDYDGTAILFTDAFFCRNPEDARFLSDTPLFNVGNDAPMVPLAKNAKDFAVRFSQLQAEISGSGDGYRHLVLQNMLQNILISAERLIVRNAGPEAKRADGAGASPGGNDKEYGRRFLSLLDRDFRTAKRVAQYAGAMGVTEKRLQKAVTRLYGKPPKEMIDDRIILEAKRLLLYGNASIKEITDQLGFDEPTNFIKYFRKHMAQTPARFRERYLA